MKYIKALIGVVILVALDQLTKLWAAGTLAVNGAVPVIKGVFELQYLENRGMAFGLLQNKKIFFVIMTVIIAAAIIWVYGRIPSTKRYMPMRIIAICIFSGAVGNFIDRILRGYVVDFFYFKLIDFPIFNMADIYVTVSAIFLLILAIFYYKEEDYSFLFLHKDKK